MDARSNISCAMILIRYVTAGLVVPPLLGGIYYSYLLGASGVSFNLYSFLISMVLAYWLVALVGIPTVLMFRSSLQRFRLGDYILIGGVAGAVALVFLCIGSGTLSIVSQIWIFILLGVIAGVVSKFILTKEFMV